MKMFSPKIDGNVVMPPPQPYKIDGDCDDDCHDVVGDYFHCRSVFGPGVMAAVIVYGSLLAAAITLV